METLAKELVGKSIMETLLLIRKAKGITQVGMACLMHTSQSFISRLESTPDNELRMRSVRRYADALGLQVTLHYKKKEQTNDQENRTKPARRDKVV